MHVAVGGRVYHLRRVLFIQKWCCLNWLCRDAAQMQWLSTWEAHIGENYGVNEPPPLVEDTEF